MRPGEIRGFEHYFRCPFCGDSSNPHHAHFSINIAKGKYHCFRCKAAGGVSDLSQSILDQLEFIPAQVLEGEEEPSPSLFDHQPDELFPHLLRGALSARQTLLPRWHFPGQPAEIFQSRSPRGELKGLVFRWLEGPMKASTMGSPALGFVGEELVPEGALRIVEGPYDVVTPQDVCIWGLAPTNAQLRWLQPYPLILCPDGDVWDRPELINLYLERFSNHRVLGIEKLEPDQDPDEVPPEERLWLPREFYRHWQNRRKHDVKTRRLPRI